VGIQRNVHEDQRGIERLIADPSARKGPPPFPFSFSESVNNIRCGEMYWAGQ
jgi:hypothetical protein